MNEQIRVAQLTGVGNPPGNSSAPRIFKLSKPFADQAVVLNLGYEQKVQVDFSGIAKEKITLVKIGEKLIILFDNQSTVTIEPFFDSRHEQLGNLTIEVGPGRELTVAEFVNSFPISTDASILPAAGSEAGNANAQASGGNFSNPSVDPINSPNGTPLLGQEELGNSGFTPPPGGGDNPISTQTIPSTPGSGLSIAVVGASELAVDESFIPSFGSQNVLPGSPNSNTDVRDFATVFSIDATAGVQSVSYVLVVNNSVSNLTDSFSGQTVMLVQKNSGEVDGVVTVNGQPEVVFTLVVDATGKVTYTELRAVHENSPGDFNEAGHIGSGLISLVATVTDTVGQTASASFDIGPHVTIYDDGPSITVVIESDGESEEGGLPFLGVDESHLSNGTSPNPALTSDTGNFSGAFSWVEGADGAKVTYQLNISATGVDTQLVDSATGHHVFLFIENGVVVGREGVNAASAAAGAKVFTIEVNADTAQVTLTDFRAVHQGSGEQGFDWSEGVFLNTGLVQLVATITDADKDTATASIDLGQRIGFFDDGPVVTSGSLSSYAVFEDGLNTAGAVGNPEPGHVVTVVTIAAADLQSLVIPGADGPVTFGINAAMEGVDTGLTQLGSSILWHVVSPTEIDGVVGTDFSRVVFTITQNGSDWVFTLKDNIDNGGTDTTTASLSLANVFTATDADGDSVFVDHGVTVTIENDVPVVTSGSLSSVIVYEDGLAGGNAETGHTATTATILGADLQTLVSAGADAPVTIGLNAAIAGNTGLTQTSGGVTTNVVWKYVSATEVDGVLANNPNQVVFTITQNGSDWVFTLKDNIDNGGTDTTTASLSLANVFTATDTDQDTVLIGHGVSVTIENDVPVVTSGSLSSVIVYEDGLAGGNAETGHTATTATILGADLQTLVSAGADAPVTIGLNAAIAGNTGLTQTSGGVTTNVVWKYVSTTEVDGVLANNPNQVVFTITQNGSDCVFTLKDNIDNGGTDTTTASLSLANVFTATDTDQDTVLIDHGVSVTIENDVPVVTSGSLSSLKVYEDGLAGGNAETGHTATTATILGTSLLSFVDAGADAPVTIGLNASISGNTGLTQTSGGVTTNVVWKYVSATEVDGVLANNPNQVVFTITKSGSNWVFTLKDNIDNGGSDTTTASLSLANVFKATDTDGDSVLLGQDLAVRIENDVPVIADCADPIVLKVYEDGLAGGNAETGHTTTTATILGTSLLSFVDAGADAPVTIGLNASISGNAGLTQTSGGVTTNVVWKYVSATEVDGVLANNPNQVVFTITKSGSNWVFTLKDNIDNGGTDTTTASLSLASVFKATDTDGDSVLLGQDLTVKIENDVPVVADCADTVSLKVYEDGLAGGNAETGHTATTATILGTSLLSFVDAGADAPVTIGLNASISGNTGLTQTSGGVTTNVVWKYVSATEVDGVLANNPNQVVFTITKSGSNWVFTLKDNIDNGGSDTTTAALSLASVFKATDTDGDSVLLGGGVTVTIENDVPVVTSGSLSSAIVYEDGLPGGNAETGHTVTTATILGTSLQSLVSAGADAPVTIGLNTAKEGALTGLKQGGTNITWHVVSATEIDGVVGGNASKVVFTLVKSGADWVFTLKDNIDNSGSDTTTASLNLAGIFKATDTDNDSVLINANITVAIENDIPVITNISNGIIADAGCTTLVGNIAIEPGADGFGLLPVSLAGNTDPVGLTFNGQQVHYVVDSTGAQLTAYVGNNPSANTIFTLTVDPNADTYTFTLLEPFTTIVNKDVSSSTSYGAGPAAERFLLTDSSGTAVPYSNEAAIVSGKKSNGSSGDVNGSTAGWGVENNNFDVNEKMRFDFTDGAQGTPGGVSSFHPVDHLATAGFTFTNYKSGDSIHYVVTLWDGSNTSSKVTYSGDIDPSSYSSTPWSTTSAGSLPPGYELFTVDFTDVKGSGKVDLASVGVETTVNVSQNLSFNVVTTDGDGDTASGTINVNINGSATLQGTSGKDAIQGSAANETIIGGAADDSLSGGGGTDKFVLDGHSSGGASLSGHDNILDFSTGDLILVDVASKNLSIGGAVNINASQFTTATDATMSSAWNGSTDRFVFNTDHNELWYSANGTAANAIDLAHLSTGITSTAIQTY